MKQGEYKKLCTASRVRRETAETESNKSKTEQGGVGKEEYSRSMVAFGERLTQTLTHLYGMSNYLVRLS